MIQLNEVISDSGKALQRVAAELEECNHHLSALMMHHDADHPDVASAIRRYNALSEKERSLRSTLHMFKQKQDALILAAHRGEQRYSSSLNKSKRYTEFIALMIISLLNTFLWVH
jgi:hypothetical protein